MSDESLIELGHRAIDMAAWARSRIEFCRQFEHDHGGRPERLLEYHARAQERQTLEAVLRQLNGEETPRAG